MCRRDYLGRPTAISDRINGLVTECGRDISWLNHFRDGMILRNFPVMLMQQMSLKIQGYVQLV